MAKSTKRRVRKATAQPAADTPLSRRALLSRAGYGAAGVLVLGGAGLWGVRHVQAVQAEHDLDRIGQGVPAIVQVHDPQCPICNALQAETRKALHGLGEGQEVLYLVANIRTPEGTGFATQYGVPHVTLLLFDGSGNLQETLRGPHEAEALRPAFARLARHG
ncbi:MAG: hypothetical protein CVT70_08590 [Alphaproteobacteria bacterium HGW-Alphaproteobacteria-1]|jgi:hypothetical protein|nr:MAG: hypothetical protein CVT70_08590 [Alphaproteobacteria bacterium HGW-Alphaproteobacteria-1]